MAEKHQSEERRGSDPGIAFFIAMIGILALAILDGWLKCNGM